MELYFSLKKGNEMAIIDITRFMKVISQSYSVRTLLDPLSLNSSYFI